MRNLGISSNSHVKKESLLNIADVSELGNIDLILLNIEKAENDCNKNGYNQ